MDRSDPNVWAFLNNLHQAGGMGAGWIWSPTGWREAALGLGSLLLGVWVAYQAM